jgi:hypothetical protein
MNERDLSGFTPLQLEIYNNLEKFRYCKCRVKGNHFTTGYILSHGGGWGTERQISDPVKHSKITVAIQGGKEFSYNGPQSRFNSQQQSSIGQESIFLTDITDVLEKRQSAEHLCKEHPSSIVLQIVRSFVLGKIIKHATKAQRIVVCDYLNHTIVRQNGIPSTPTFTFDRLVIVGVHAQKFTGLYLDGDREAKNLEPNLIKWDSLRTLERIEGLTSSNEKLRIYSRDPRLLWLEESQRLTAGLTQDQLSKLKASFSQLQRMVVGDSQFPRFKKPAFPELAEQLKQKTKFEFVQLDILHKLQEAIIALDTYQKKLGEMFADYKALGIELSGEATDEALHLKSLGCDVEDSSQA